MSRVLLVDDEKDLLLVTQKFLEKELPKFNFHAVHTAYEAIETLEESHFDIIVSDYQMPGMDGLELLEWLRKQDNLTPFVMFTGRGREEVAIRALNLGADYYLRKSRDPESLYKELSHIIESVVEHRKTVEALKHSEREKALILSSTPDNITFQNRELAISWANEAAAISADLRPEELVGRFCFEVWNQRSAPCPECPVVQAIRTGEPHQGERTTPDKRVWSIRGYPVRDEAGEIIGAVEVTREITAQKRAEGALLETEANYRTLVEHSLQGILVFQDGAIKFANPVIEEISGYSLEELFQFTPSDLQNLIYPDYRSMFWEYIASLLKGEIESKRHEYQICPKDGGFRWVEAFSIPISYQNKPAVQASVLDITERKQTERALQQAYEKREELEHIINRSPAVVFLWQNAAGWPVEFVSDNVAQFGYTPGDFYSGEVLFADIIHPQDLNRIANEVEKYSQDGRQEFVQEYRIIAKTGEIYWVDDRTWIRRGPDGAITHYQGIIVDISERIQTEKTLKRQKEELSEFVHTMAHDLRSRLLFIDGYASILQENYDPAYAERISRNVGSMSKILNRSVALADAGLVIEKDEEVDLDQLVSEVAESIIPENIRYLQAKLPTVRGDQEKLVQVFQNLFENAVIHATASRIEIQRQDLIDGLQILVKNDGTPIPAENRPKLFQQGFTTKEGEGGLGLAIVQRIVEAHDWKISLLENPETTFCLEIPNEEPIS